MPSLHIFVSENEIKQPEKNFVKQAEHPGGTGDSEQTLEQWTSHRTYAVHGVAPDLTY